MGAHANGVGPVLLVDDDLDIREILPETLADMGFDVVTAANGLEALTMVGQMPVRPSVILLDLMMPVMDGYGFLEERTKKPELASIPLAIITAGHGIDRARIGDQAPIIWKPFDVPHLVSVLHKLRAGSEG
jgi:CheY-like chemotaxis protein